MRYRIVWAQNHGGEDSRVSCGYETAEQLLGALALVTRCPNAFWIRLYVDDHWCNPDEVRALV